MFRRIIFWTHLCCGIAAGLVIFTMSLTGVLLTYERQMKERAARQHYVPVSAQQERLPLERLMELQQLADPSLQATALVLTNDPGAPVSFRAGRRVGPTLNPYTGTEFPPASPRMDAVFAWLTGFHRWFNVEGENRAMARQVTGVSNVIFLFLILSGLYLWLPALYKGAVFKVRLWFKRAYPDSKARDFHWHHIFGFWSALPLFAVVYTGAVISYPWAANLMYAALGAEIPVPPATAPTAPGGNAAAAPAQQAVAAQAGAQPFALQQTTEAQQGSAAMPRNEALTFMSLDALVAAALAQDSASWKRLTLTLPKANDTSLQVEIDKGNGAQAQLRHTLILDRVSGAVQEQRGFSDIPDAQRLRGIARFLHTGEVLGFWGQTIAGLVSLFALFLVWTGFALSWRRLIVPLLRKKQGK